MSAVTSVPALVLKAVFGKRIAPRSFALFAMYCLTDVSALSIVPLVVIAAMMPPGRILSKDFARK